MTTKDAVKDRLISEERAVSPVIGVILMVAITVILAAVIGTFVLDLGQSAGNTAPQASLAVTVTANSDTVDIEHRGGDAIVAENTRIVVSNGSSTLEFTSSAKATLSVGDSVTINTTDPPNSTWTDWGSFSESSGNPTFGFNSGETITITLIDTDSQKITYETDVTA